MGKWIAIIIGLGLVGVAAWYALPDQGAGEPQAHDIVAEKPAIRVDGDTRDWRDGALSTTTLKQGNPDQAGVSTPWQPVAPLEARYGITVDDERVYMVVVVPEPYRFNPEDHRRSPALAVSFRLDEEAGSAMGAPRENLTQSLGEVDMWHWELDCPAGVPAGGAARRPEGVAGGDDAACNLDDEYAETPQFRYDDDGEGSENSLYGVWEHTARSEGIGAEGRYVFELSRPLVTDDPHDVQLARGQTVRFGIAYWSPTESNSGWTPGGHLTSAEEHGWLVAELP